METVYKLASCIVRDGALGVQDAVGWTVRLAATLEIIHRVGAAHGRISPKAVQVLGTSYQAGGFVLDTPDLSDDVAYQSPERLDGGHPSPPDDTWAVAVLLYESLTGRLPFAGTTAPEVMANILTRARAPLADFGISDPRLQLVIDDALHPDRALRLPTVARLKERLVACAPEFEDLPPLKLGKPDLALFDETTDDEGEKLTAVLKDHPAILQARLDHAIKKAAARTAAQAAAVGGLEPDSVATRVAEPSPEIVAEVERAAARSEALFRQVQAAEPGDAELSPPPSSRWPDLDLEPPGGADAALPRTEVWPGNRPEGAVARASPSSSGSVPAVHPDGGLGASSSGRVAAVAADLRSGPSSSGSVPAVHPDGGLGASSSGSLPSVGAAPPTRRPARRAGTLLRDIVLGLLFLTAGGVAAYYLYGSDDTSAPGPSPTTAPSPDAVPSSSAGAGTTASATEPDAAAPSVGTSSASAAATASSGPSAQPTADGSAATSAGPSSDDLAACMMPLFPEGTFAFTKTYFDFVCPEEDARTGGNDLRVQVIRSGGGRRGVTLGMREWARLGWYEMAAFAVARRLCCASPPPLKTTPSVEHCRLDPALQQLGDMVVDGSNAQVEQAITDYTNVVHCLVRAGAARSFGRRGPPGGSSARVFRQFMARARLAAKSR